METIKNPTIKKVGKEEVKKEMPIDLAMDCAKFDCANAINEVLAKYSLSIGMAEIILSKLYNEVVISSKNELERLKRECE